MALFDPAHVTDPMTVLYLLCALLMVGAGGGVLLYERFAEASRRFFVLTLVLGLALVALGMPHGAGDPAVREVWLRIAYLWIPFSVPALYWLAQEMAAARRLTAIVGWAVGAAFAALNAAGPWLVDGLRALFVHGTLASFGWLAVAYLSFELVGVGLTVWVMGRSRIGALSGAERTEQVLLMVAAVVASLTLLDYGLADDPFRAGLLTPLALLAGAWLVALTAVRYRLFAQQHSFATGEVLQTMADAVIVADRLGRIRATNPAAQRLLGGSRSELRGTAVGRVVGWAQDDGWRGLELSHAADSEELDLLPVGGEAIRVSASIAPIRFGSRSVGTVIVARDIRERIETQRALEASQRRYASLFWHNPAILFELDLDGRVVAANPTAESLLGVPVAELRGETLGSFLFDRDIEEARAVFEAVLDGQSREYELAVRSVGKGTRRLRGVTVPIFEGSEVTGVFGVALDLTEQYRVKRELEVQRRYFADLFNTSPEGVVLIDSTSDEVLRVNDEFVRMFGYTKDEVLGRKLTALIVPEDRREEGPALNAQARADGRVRTETVRQRKDGSTVEVSVLAREVRIPGEPRQIYGVYRDITERRATERALRAREQELQHAQKLEAVGMLAGGIAHDFNNLLTVINGQARFALENAGPDSDVRDELTEIEKAGTRAASLTQQLLAYSRRQMLQMEVVDLNAVVRGLRGMVRRLIGEHIRVETRLTDRPIRVRADQGQLEQVLVNLVVNARDAMPDGGTLTLETDVLELPADDSRVERWQVEPGELVCLRVRDTGQGMDPETLEHVFEPFFTTKEQGKGTGLGLATVFGIIKQSDGHVTVSSEPGVGTECTVCLPRVDEAPSPTRGPDERRSLDCPAEATILVVEDEDAVRKLAVKALEREGCTVLAAGNGVEALEIVASHEESLDLVITDLIMPDMGGRELAAELRKLRPDVPVLLMSGYDDTEVPDASGSTGFLAKPFTPAMLTSRVAEVLESD